MNNLRPEIALGAMKLLSEGAATANIGAFGLEYEDFALLTGDAPWVGANRPKISRCLSTMCFGTLDVIGVTRFPVSAEYQAAIVAMFVHPCNFQVASDWLSKCMSNEDLSQGREEMGAPMASPQQIFALVIQIKSQDAGVALKRFFERNPLMAPETEAT